MNPKNKADFEFLGILDYHKAGITGKNLKLCSFESENNGHGRNVADLCRQINPEAVVEGRSRPVLHISSGKLINGTYEKLEAFYRQIVADKFNVVTMSLGGNNSIDDDYLTREILLKTGVICLTSAGNKTVSAQGTLDSWISVGAAIRNSQGQVVRQSNTQPGEIASLSYSYTSSGGVFTGTSSATPVAAAMVLLYLQRYLQETGTLPTHEQTRAYLHSNVHFGEKLFILSPLSEQLIKKPMIQEELVKLNTPAGIYDGRFLFPGREFVEALGGSAKWDAQTKTGTFKLGDTIIEIVEGKGHFKVTRTKG